MTIYLPNPDMKPTGQEPCEFLDLPAMTDEEIRPSDEGALTAEHGMLPDLDSRLDEDGGRGAISS